MSEIERFADMVRTLRPNLIVSSLDPVDLVFDPPLTPAEQATLNDMVTLMKFSVDMTLAEWQSVKTDAQNLKAYLGVATPTLVQTAGAAKAIIRILAVIVRD